MTRQPQRRTPLFAATLAAAIALTACGPARPSSTTIMNTTSADSAAQLRELKSRPDIDQITQRYDDMRAVVRERLSAEIGLAPWIKRDEISRSGCRDYPDVDQALKEARGLSRWAVETNLPDAKWPQAVQIVTDIAGSHGFTKLTTVVDQPGDHEISLSDQYGGELIFGTKLNTILSARTGCHLRAAGQQGTSPPAT